MGDTFYPENNGAVHKCKSEEAVVKGHNYVNEKRFDQDDKTQRKKNPITLYYIVQHKSSSVS